MSTEDSYYPSVVYATNYLGGDYRSSARVRPSDFHILARQRALGWAFFSHRNVEFLLKKVRKVHPAADFDHILDDMLAVYDSNADETYVRPGTEQPLVDKLNEYFIDRWARSINRKIDYSRRYMDVLAQPNPIKPRPEAVNQRDASIVMFEKELSHFKDEQGGGDYISSISRVVPQDMEEKKFYLTKLDSDYY